MRAWQPGSACPRCRRLVGHGAQNELHPRDILALVGVQPLHHFIGVALARTLEDEGLAHAVEERA
eukprot:1863713-Lingulodinium_polyedra.AAC.1